MLRLKVSDAPGTPLIHLCKCSGIYHWGLYEYSVEDIRFRIVKFIEQIYTCMKGETMP